MFSMIVQIFRWLVTLAIAGLLTLSVLVFRFRWEGGGRFEIGLKEHIGLEGTLVDARPGIPSPAGSASSPPAPVATAHTSSRQLPGSERCSEIRQELARSVVAYLKKTRLPMNRLDIFALLEADVLNDIPSCPRGGAYSQTPDGTVHCSLHGP